MRHHVAFVTRYMTASALGIALLSGCSAQQESPQSSTSTSSPSSSKMATTPADDQTEEDQFAPSGSDDFSLMVTGDVLLHPQLLDEAKATARTAGGNGKDFDFSPLIAGLKSYVQDADVALCNLETPIGTPPYSGYPRFTVPAQILVDLKIIGYDGCTTATNHTVDAGNVGVNRTLDALDENGLFATGSYRGKKESTQAPIMKVNGAKLGVIASTYSLNGLTASADWQVDTGVEATKLVSRARLAKKAGADVLVAAIHDGTEYTNRPTAKQRKLGRELSESGVFDFIYMHHTHSVLPIEKHAGTWIVYGLGNSIAKHATQTILNREGISVKATFSRDPNTDEWTVSKLQWVPHQLSHAPVKWCQVFEVSTCLPQADAKASRARTTVTVNAYGAFNDGLSEWKLD